MRAVLKSVVIAKESQLFKRMAVLRAVTIVGVDEAIVRREEEGQRRKAA